MLCRVKSQSLRLCGAPPTISVGWLCMSGFYHSMILLMGLLHILRFIHWNQEFLICMQIQLPLKGQSHGFILIKFYIPSHNSDPVVWKIHLIFVGRISVPQKYPNINYYL